MTLRVAAFLAVGSLLWVPIPIAAAIAAAPGLRGHYVHITSPRRGQVVGSTVTVRGTASPPNATVFVGYRRGSGEPEIGSATSHAGRWRLRARLPRKARVIVVVSASGGEDSVRVRRR